MLVQHRMCYSPGVNPRLAVITICFALFWPSGCVAEGQGGTILTQLELHKPVARESGPNHSDSFTLEVSGGQFVHIDVEKRGVDVTVSVTGPDGKQLLSVDTPNGAFGSEPVSWLAAQSGTYAVKASNSPASTQTGSYSIVWRDLRTPDNKDFQEIQAERLLAQAVAAEAAGTKEGFQNGLSLYGKSAVLWQSFGNHYEEALCLHRIGRVYEITGDYLKARDYYARALPIERESGDRAYEGRILTSIGLVSAETGDETKALDYLAQGLSIQHAIGNQAGEAMAVHNLGKVADDLGEKQKALDYFQQALSLYRALGNKPGESIILNNLGKVHSDLGDKQVALDYYKQALPIERASGNKVGEAQTMNYIGRVYSHLGDKKTALQYFDQALADYRAMGDKADEALMLNNLGDTYGQMGKTSTAIAYFTRALPIARATGAREFESMILENLGAALSDEGHKQQALEDFNRALAIERGSGDREGEASTLLNSAILYRGIKQRQKALLIYNQVLPIQRSLGDREGEATTLNELRALYQTPSPPLGIFFGKQAVNILQSIRRDNRGLDPQLLQSYRDSVASSYRGLARLLIAQSRFAEAEEVLDLLKDKEASDYIRRDSISDQLRSATLRDFESSALQRYNQIVDQIAQEGQRRAELLAKRQQGALSPDEQLEAQKLGADLAAANIVLNRFLTEQETTFAPESAIATQVHDFRKAASIQSKLQQFGPDVVAIYTLVVEDKYIAMLVTSGSRKAYTTGIKKADLNKKLFAFRRALESPASNPLPLAQELYRILFPEHLRQDLDKIHAQTILWSLDGTLRYVPISALHDGKSYLVERFRNSLINPESLASLAEEDSGKWQGEGFGVSQAYPPFTSLPSVPEELHRVFGTDDSGTAPITGVIRLDRDFTKSTLQQDLAGKLSPIVHIATHFDAEPGDAANSTLLLGDGTRLTLSELAADDGLFNGVDIVTLSACSTAFQVGTADGREVDSLGVVAQTIGAKSVIASLWSVSDEATAVLMQRFYQNWKRHPEAGKSEALRMTEAELATGAIRPSSTQAGNRGFTTDAADSPPQSSTGWTHPYYWAPFILIGNVK